MHRATVSAGYGIVATKYSCQYPVRIFAFGLLSSFLILVSSFGAPLSSLPLGEARWTSGFWADRFEICRTNTIPSLWSIMEGTNYSQFYQNFRIAAGLAQGRHRGAPFNDGDFYKWLEAASATLAITNDPVLERRLEEIISVIGKAQRPDGYIHTAVLIPASVGAEASATRHPSPFEDRLQFETYNMGHLLSAACVHYAATGRTNFLALAMRTADFLCATFEHPTPEIARCSICPSHYMGMVDMYRATKESRYLTCAKSLLAARALVNPGDDDNQDRIPFEQQTNAMGHAVRANYLYAGAADLFLETQDEALWRPLQPIWTNVVERKMYLTGGCGALFDGASPDGSKDQKSITRVHQSYGRDYQLPNLSAHNETCANIGNVLWNWRMFLATGEGRFMDVVELALYNSVLSGESLDGKTFFYVNPLRSFQDSPLNLRWGHERKSFVSSFCCPPNLARTITEVSRYAYAKSADAIWVNLYGGNQLETEIAGGTLVMTQQTEYPWNGRVQIGFPKCPGKEFTVNCRVPGWSERAELRVNGRLADTPRSSKGHLALRRTWRTGDVLEVSFPMPTRLLESNPLVEETMNQVAVKRGPLVYCLESTDLPRGVHLTGVSILADADLVARFDSRLLGGVVCLEGTGWARSSSDWNGSLYRTISSVPGKAVKLQFIPYFAWANRGKSDMSVWIPLR
jgi:DUF1680 family protein